MNPIPDSYYPMLAKIESSNNPNAFASTSSASGLYQFTHATWKGLGGQWGTDTTKPFGSMHPDAAEQQMRAGILTQQNAAYLLRKGIAINNATLYAAHFFGPYVASLVLKAANTQRADLIAGQAATDANPSVLRGKTVAQFLAWLKAKTGVAAR